MNTRPSNLDLRTLVNTVFFFSFFYIVIYPSKYIMINHYSNSFFKNIKKVMELVDYISYKIYCIVINKILGVTVSAVS